MLPKSLSPIQAHEKSSKYTQIYTRPTWWGDTSYSKKGDYTEEGLVYGSVRYLWTDIRV